MRIDVDKVTLKSGGHRKPSEGLCVMEAVAYIAREKHSDHPECVSPVIAAFLRAWNDALNDEDRQKLKALIPVVMDTASTPEDEDRRAWMALDWLVREHTPAWLRLAGLTEHADRLARLPEFKAGMNVPAVFPVLDAARHDAAAAWAAAWDAAAGAAARDAAARTAAAGTAARAAAWDAAARTAAARGAAAAAARTAAAGTAAAWAAAWDAAWAAAGTAAWAAAWDAAWDAAARDAAWAALRPTVEQLQDSALALVERMCWLKDDA